MKRMVTLRRIDAVKRVDDYEVLVIDGVEIDEFHAASDAFHAGEYCVFVERDLMLPAHPRRSWTPTARTATVQLYPLGEFPEIAEEMMMLSHDHDSLTAEDYDEIRNTDFGAPVRQTGGLNPLAVCTQERALRRPAHRPRQLARPRPAPPHHARGSAACRGTAAGFLLPFLPLKPPDPS